MADVNPIELQSFLASVGYPIHRDGLVEHARDAGADPDAVDALERLPAREYSSPADVSSEIGEASS